MLAQLQGTPCGVSSEVTGLTGAPRAVTPATATARVLPPDAGEPQRLEHSWLDVPVHRAGDLGRDLAADVFGGLHAGAPPAEVDRLLETVKTHLSGSGSVADTAYVRHIPNWAITGARLYTMTARYNRGLLVPSTITFQYDQFVANPHHAQTRITYDPATDRGADWNYDTALNSPTANGYSRGCSSITRCRNGS